MGFYNTTGASYGLQAGAQTYGYALFLMNDTAIQSLNKAGGFEVGLGPSLVVVNKGTAKNLTTTTLKADIYAVVFDQKGLMGGVGDSREQDHEDEPQVADEPHKGREGSSDA